MVDRVGQQLGNYNLTRLLGQGGFADVYQGEHVYLKTQAAIKVMQTRLAQDDIEGFVNEARTIAGLKHPHIVRVLDFGIDNGTPFLVMDFAPMGTLRQRYPRGTRLPPAIISSYVKQVAAALQYAHDKKLIHRDIKPENMLLEAENEILLSDFGIALVAQSSRYQNTQDSVGTLAYMAPEQLQGHPRIASDQYSLGIVVYEWLTGDRPFHGSFIEMASQHMLVPPPPLHEKVPDILSPIEEVVMVALAKDPQQRFANVQAFANAFEQACQSAPAQTFVSGIINLPGQGQPLAPTVVVHHSSQPLPISQLAAADIKTPLTSGALPPTVIVPSPIPTIKTLLTFREHNHTVGTIAWSPDGTRIASGSADNTIQLWDAASGFRISNHRWHTGEVTSLAWSPDGTCIASGGADRTVQVWNVSTGRTIFIYRHNNLTVNTVAWSPDGDHIASASDDRTVQVWQTSTGYEIFSFAGHSRRVVTVAWSPDGRRIASGGADSTAQVWDAFRGGNVLSYRGHAGWWVWVRALSWSPDGTYIASASDDKTVQVWHTTTGRTIFTFRGHTHTVQGVAWSPDGKRIASGSWDKTVQIWDAFTGEDIITYRGHSGAIKAVIWSPDGTRIASSSLGEVQVWQARQN